MRSADVQSATANRYNESDAGQTCVCFGAALEQRLDKLRKEEEEEKSSKRQRRIEDLKQDRAGSVSYRGAHPVILHAIRRSDARVSRVHDDGHTKSMQTGSPRSVQ